MVAGMKPNSQASRSHLLSEDDESESEIERVPSKGTQRSRGLVYILAIFLIASVGINLKLYLRQEHSDLDQLCTAHTTLNWSPILDDVDIKYSAVEFNGSLFKQNIYRQPGSPEVDKAWIDLGISARSFPVSEDMAVKAGISSGQVKRPEAQGGGFFVFSEALHQLHCLNMVRQGLWYNYEYYRDSKIGVWSRSDALAQVHIGHCLDIVRQQLMCTADVAVMGQIWLQREGKTVAYPDFNRLHKCRNWEDIIDWVRKHEVAETDYGELREGDIIYEDYP